MRARPLAVAVSLSLIAAPAVAQDFLGRLAQGAAQSAAQRLASRAVEAATRPRPATPPAVPAPAAATAPAEAQAEPLPSEASASPETTLVIRNKMPVIASDGARVAETIHVNGAEESFGPDRTFFTTDQYYRLRRIYGREATVRGGSVHLKMTAAQYRARNQNPEHHPG